MEGLGCSFHTHGRGIWGDGLWDQRAMDWPWRKPRYPWTWPCMARWTVKTPRFDGKHGKNRRVEGNPKLPRLRTRRPELLLCKADQDHGSPSPNRSNKDSETICRWVWQNISVLERVCWQLWGNQSSKWFYRYKRPSTWRIQLLCVLPENQGGLFPVAVGLFHPSPKVRFAVVDLLARMSAHMVRSSMFVNWRSF